MTLVSAMSLKSVISIFGRECVNEFYNCYTTESVYWCVSDIVLLLDLLLDILELCKLF